MKADINVISCQKRPALLVLMYHAEKTDIVQFPYLHEGDAKAVVVRFRRFVALTIS